MRPQATGKLNPIVLVVLLAVALASLWFLMRDGNKTQSSSTTSAAILSSPQPTPASTAASGVPEWVPVYPGAQVSGVATRNAGVETYTEFGLEVQTDCAKVVEWYDEKLKMAGFDITKFFHGDFGCDGTMRAEGPGNSRGLRLSGSGDRKNARYSISAVVRNLPGSISNNASMPSWIPQYPNSAPANLQALQQGSERRITFNFMTDDDAKAVIDWYEARLKEARFTIVSVTVFDSGTARLTANDATGRSILNIRMEPAGSRKVVALEAREGVQ